VVSFKNAIIILTSNLGSAEIYQATYKHTRGGGVAERGGEEEGAVPLEGEGGQGGEEGVAGGAGGGWWGKGSTGWGCPCHDWWHRIDLG
jgi:hypothetical protein